MLLNRNLARILIGRKKQKILAREWPFITEAREGLPKLTPKYRNCLKCGGSFFSEGAHNRICAICHINRGDTNEY